MRKILKARMQKRQRRIVECKVQVRADSQLSLRTWMKSLMYVVGSAGASHRTSSDLETIALSGISLLAPFPRLPFLRFPERRPSFDMPLTDSDGTFSLFAAALLSPPPSASSQTIVRALRPSFLLARGVEEEEEDLLKRLPLRTRCSQGAGRSFASSPRQQSGQAKNGFALSNVVVFLWPLAATDDDSCPA